MSEAVIEMESSTAWRATKSQEDQWMLGSKVFQIFQTFGGLCPDGRSAMLELLRDEHTEYLTQALRKLGHKFSVLDANRPWLCYWILHSIALLRDSIDDELEINAVDFLNRCQDSDGGYGGGPGQMPHIATTYAAVNSLLTLSGQRSLSSINREKLRSFLLRMKDTSGGFRMHDGGEIDVRACYTAISVASVLNILDDELVQNVGNYILSCQTFEGGIAGEPGSEAHGGYTFCGLATMILIDEVNRLDLLGLIDWVVFRQGIEGGFQGRINKLVDGCYSFWQGGVCSLIQRLQSSVDEQLGLSDAGESDSSTCLHSSETSDLSDEDNCLERSSSPVDVTCHIEHKGQLNASGPANLFNIGCNFIRRDVDVGPLYDTSALQQFILLCCQVNGGFRDKPGANRDHYHTCYCLSGLSLCQYSWSVDADSPPFPGSVLGPYSNLLEPVHPLYNIVLDRYYEACEFFSRS